MPIYEYQCGSCGLRVEHLWKLMSQAQDTIPCKECGKEMAKLISAANFAFKFPASQMRGLAPPNTGTSIDHNFDKVVGLDSEKKWKAIDERNSVKDAAVRTERKAGKLVNRDHLVPKPDGDYRVITEPERVRANENREAAAVIGKAAMKNKPPNKEEG